MEEVIEVDMRTEKCPSCKNKVEYVEFECDKPFTAPAELRFKALNVWGFYSAPKEVICETPEFVHFKFLGNGSERLVKMLGFDREKFADGQERLRNEKQPCQNKDKDGRAVCGAEGKPVFSMFEPDEPIGYYCDEHCFENGACSGCYYFMAGCELFDFSPSGLCDECQQEIEHDFRDDYSDDDDREYNYGDDDDY